MLKVLQMISHLKLKFGLFSALLYLTASPASSTILAAGGRGKQVRRT